MAEVTAELKELGDKLAGLTLKQAVDLAEYLKQEHKIEAAAGGTVMMAAPSGAAPAEAEAEKTTRDEGYDLDPANIVILREQAASH